MTLEPIVIVKSNEDILLRSTLRSKPNEFSSMSSVQFFFRCRFVVGRAVRQSSPHGSDIANGITAVSLLDVGKKVKLDFVMIKHAAHDLE